MPYDPKPYAPETCPHLIIVEGVCQYCAQRADGRRREAEAPIALRDQAERDLWRAVFAASFVSVPCGGDALVAVRKAIASANGAVVGFRSVAGSVP